MWTLAHTTNSRTFSGWPTASWHAHSVILSAQTRDNETNKLTNNAYNQEKKCFVKRLRIYVKLAGYAEESASPRCKCSFLFVDSRDVLWVVSVSRRGGMICQILRVLLLGDQASKLLTTFVAVPTSQNRTILGIQVGVSCACEFACVTQTESALPNLFRILLGNSKLPTIWEYWEHSYDLHNGTNEVWEQRKIFASS